MALYQNGVLVSGSGNIPELTLAQYNALSVKPTYWVRTDLDYNDIDATNVAYDNTGSGLSATKVQGAIDEIQTEIGSTDISAIGDGTVSGAISDLDTDLTTLQGVVNNFQPRKMVTLNVSASGTETYTLSVRSTYLLTAQNNVGHYIGFVQTGNSAVINKAEIANSNWEITYSGLTLTIRNAQIYTLPFTIIAITLPS